MFDVEFLSNDAVNFDAYENIGVNFSKSIEFNPKLLLEIDKVYKRTLNDKAKFIFGCYHLNIFDSLETIVRNTNESDDFILDLTEFIANYFDKLNQELNISSLQEFDEFIHVLKLSSIIIEDAVEENDMELFFEAFYQVQSRFKKNKHSLDNLIGNIKDSFNNTENILSGLDFFEDEYHDFSSIKDMAFYILDNKSLLHHISMIMSLLNAFYNLVQFKKDSSNEEYELEYEEFSSQLVDIEQSFYTEIYEPGENCNEETLSEITNSLLG